MIEIQRNIEEIRKKKGIKQATIADVLGVGQSAYSNYISRNSDIKFSLLEKIAEILQVPVIDIITYPEVYVKGQKKCEGCEERDKTIQNLNKYIEILEKKIK
ncbi:MAG: helix-turn-helix transcriptional regulator [Alphaproteobacteria bacterium]|nr:helix-turn-helix transcriptional regulator [Alphaproteobacteria bacterium]